MIHAAESMHWYTKTGDPMYEVEAVKGGMRAATLRDARKLGLVPSVTSIIKCAAAPGLERWKQEQVLLAALTLPRREAENDKDFCGRILQDSGEQARKAANRGTQIHAAIQGHFEGEAPDEDLWLYVQGVMECLRQNCTPQVWTPERSFAHALGFGGKCDLSSDEWVVDFKTKEFAKEAAGELKTWDEHAMQLAAYRVGLEAGTRCAIVYVSTTEIGAVRFIEIERDELDRGWTMFQGLLSYWKAKNLYWPELWKEAA